MSWLRLCHWNIFRMYIRCSNSYCLCISDSTGNQMEIISDENDEGNPHQETTSIWQKTHPPLSITMTSSTWAPYTTSKLYFYPSCESEKPIYVVNTKLLNCQVKSFFGWLKAFHIPLYLSHASYLLLRILVWLTSLILGNRKRRVSEISYKMWVSQNVVLL